jgi:RNA polymerase sigma-70 factor (ECF subfamily)
MLSRTESVSNTSENTSDRQWIEQALRGDQEAFRALVDRHKGSVYACAYALTRHAADAADVTQETFIRFHRHLQQFDPGRPLKPYLVAIAANTARSWLSRKKRRNEVGDESAAMEQLADHRPEPDARAAAQERKQAIRGFLHTLPETMRRICVLFYLGGHSCREVATALEMTENAVKVNLHRARKRLLHSGLAAWRTLG